MENCAAVNYIAAMYNRTTRNIRIIVQPQFLEGQSRPEEEHFVWAYTITD